MQSALRVQVDATSVEAQRVLAYLSLGLIDATTAGALAPEAACASFFVPVFLQLVDHPQVEPALLKALHAASELADVARLIPQARDQTTQKIRQDLLLAITELNRGPAASGGRLVSIQR